MHPKEILSEIREDLKSGAFQLCEKGAEAVRKLLHYEPSPSKKAILDFLVELSQTHPAMAPLFRLSNLVARTIEETPQEIDKERARAVIDEFLEGMHKGREKRIQLGLELLKDISFSRAVRVLTYSHSSEVRELLLEAKRRGIIIQVLLSEARPALEGLHLAEILADWGIPTTLFLDVALPSQVKDSDVVLIGADSILASGVVHKIGTFELAVKAKVHGIPFFSMAGTEKIWPLVAEERFRIEEHPGEKIVKTTKNQIVVKNIPFDITPSSFVLGYITEEGILTAEEITNLGQKIKVSSLFL